MSVSQMKNKLSNLETSFEKLVHSSFWNLVMSKIESGLDSKQ